MPLPKMSSLSTSVSVVVLALLALSFAQGTHAAEPPKAPVTAMSLPSSLGEKPTPLEVFIDKSVPITLSEPAATVFIANPDIADIQVLTPNEVMVYGKKEGHTTLKITDKKGQNLVFKTVMVTQNLAALREALRLSLPGFNIKVESIPNGIVLTGDVDDASVIEDARRLALRYVPQTGGDVINRLRVKANNQIQIRVRFAEVARDVDKRFGINWDNLATLGGGIAIGLATGNVFSGAGTLDASRTIISDGKGGLNDTLNTSFTKGRYTVNGMIDALAKNGLITILAEPSLTALSGETASFLAGGEFPVPVPNGDQITIEWKHYGVSLSFTPTLISENRINLHVRPEVSQLSETGAVRVSGISVPALTTRRAETTLELNSGQSFALAGLLNSQQAQSIDKFPFLGDMPVLGALFRSNRFQNNESELVIIITPYIVKPSTQEELASPTDGFAPPSDTDMIFKLRETSSDPNARPLSGTDRAIRVDMPDEEETPPEAAPVAPVAAIPVPKAPKPAPTAPLPVSLPASKPAQPAPVAPKGPGGFIVE